MPTLISLILQYRYLVLFPLAAFEGPVISLIVGFLVSVGQFDFLPAYAVLLLGDIIPDTFYYYIGRLGDKKNLVRKYASKKGIISQNIPLLKKLWHDHGKKTMFLGKLAYGLSTPFLISAGLVKMPYKKFISYAVPVSFFQYFVLLTAGYYLGSSYQAAEKYFKIGGYVFAGLLIVFVIAYVIFIKYARRSIVKLEKEEEVDNVSVN